MSLVLLLAFGLPTVAPALDLAAKPDSRLPACCRRDSAHHCTMSTQEREALLDGVQFTSVHSKCPYYPTAATLLQLQQHVVFSVAQLLSETHRPTAVAAQTQTSERVAEDGVRHKRGPPPQLL